MVRYTSQFRAENTSLFLSRISYLQIRFQEYEVFETYSQKHTYPFTIFSLYSNIPILFGFSCKIRTLLLYKSYLPRS